MLADVTETDELLEFIEPVNLDGKLETESHTLLSARIEKITEGSIKDLTIQRFNRITLLYKNMYTYLNIKFFLKKCFKI